jgi:RNA polymerase sigma-70 factor (ECF subfamily)
MTDPLSENVWADLREGVRRFVARRVRDAHAAEDIAQDVMLKVRANLPALPAGERLHAWVIAVARNSVVDHYRARAKDAALAEAEILAADEPSPDPSAELAGCLARMIERLPQPYGEALRLADIEGLSQQELADRAGVSLSGAKSRVQRAREKLRAMLLDCCDIERNRHGGVVDYRTTPRSKDYCGGGDDGGEDGGGGGGDASCG